MVMGGGEGSALSFLVRATVTTETKQKSIFKLVDHHKHLLENWPTHWPRKENHVNQNDVTLKQYQELANLIGGRAGERDLERYLSENREVLSLIVWMFSTGHHMSWVFPKEQIRPASGPTGGLIPDYLMAGASSSGVQWFMAELKGADKRAFITSGNRVSLSTDANRGICQLLNYIDLSSRDQAYLRDGLELSGFREPQGILLIGTDKETEDLKVQNFKNAWNRINSKVQIRSYSGLLRTVHGKLKDFNKL
jgi:hypothetical protein